MLFMILMIHNNYDMFHLELIVGFAQNVSVPESENAALCITFSSEFSTNFSINVGPQLQHNLTLPGIGKSILYFLSLVYNTRTVNEK